VLFIFELHSISCNAACLRDSSWQAMHIISRFVRCFDRPNTQCAFCAHGKVHDALDLKCNQLLVQCLTTSLRQDQLYSRATAIIPSSKHVLYPSLQINTRQDAVVPNLMPLFCSRSVPLLEEPSANPADGSSDTGAADRITCCATSHADFGSGSVDVSFFGTWNGDVVAIFIRDAQTSASPAKNQRKKPSMKAAATAALLAASLKSSSPHHTTTSSSVFRIMVCQRTICAIAASSRLPFKLSSASVAILCSVDRMFRTVVACARGWGCWIGNVSESGLNAIGVWKVPALVLCLLKLKRIYAGAK
jgi:hypothetical protein